MNKELDNLYNLNINNLKDFYTIPDADQNQIKAQDILKIINESIEDFHNLENYEQDKLFQQLDILYSIIKNILNSNKDKEIFKNNDEAFLKILSLMKRSKEKGYKDYQSLFEQIFKILVYNLENSSDIYDKITDFIAEDFKQDPKKEIDINLDTLAEQTNYSSAVKDLLNNKELLKAITELYSDKDLSIQRRRHISNIYNNLTKNTYNVDNIIQDNPEFIKT